MSSLIIEVCKIEKIEKHPNADRLSIVTIKGWQCIVSLEQYAQGDLVVFCPPDSLIPDDIIEKYNLEYLKNGKRIRTVKLRKFISQGLVLDAETKWKEGKDVAKLLGITKYEPPVDKSTGSGVQRASRKKRNPSFHKYTDIENIKNYNRVFKNGDLVVVTEKIHGTNFRAGRLTIHPGYSFIDKIKYFLNKYFFKNKYEFVYGSHNIQITKTANRKCFYGEDVYGKIANRYNLAEVIPEDYIVYGEIYGKKIQELEYDLDITDLVIFDVMYKGKFLDWSEVVEFCLYRNLPTVPVLAVEQYNEDTISKYTSGKSTIAKHIREGCVIKSVKEEKDPRVGRKILKSVSPEYLLTKNRTEHH